MGGLTRDQILARQDLPVEPIPVPAWGNSVVYVRGLSAAGRDAYEASLSKTEGVGRKAKRVTDLSNVRAKLLARCLCDEQGAPLFTDADVEALGDKSAEALEPLIEAAQRLSGMTDNDIERLEGNSEPAPGDDSASELQTVSGGGTSTNS